MEEFPQSMPNLTAASQNLYELIKGGGISIYPDDDIRLAVQRAIAVEGSRGWKISKEKTSHKIDIVVAIAQAVLAAVHMGRQHVCDGRIHLVQQKTKARLRIPIHPELHAVLAKTDTDMTFLVTSQGQPFSAPGFGNWFREACDEAGLPKGCWAHGLRKAAARRLAEAGCTVHQIASITGHKTLKEVAHYAAAADQVRLADAAMRALSGLEREQKAANLDNGLAKTARNPLKKGT
jgi:hypothetical protein